MGFVVDITAEKILKINLSLQPAEDYVLWDDSATWIDAELWEETQDV